MTKSINWIFKYLDDGTSFTWSFIKFDEWKKNFNVKYLELFWKRFREEVKDPIVRQAIYETLLRVRKTWIFLTDTNHTDTNWIIIDEIILNKSIKVNNLVRNILE